MRLSGAIELLDVERHAKFASLEYQLQRKVLYFKIDFSGLILFTSRIFLSSSHYTVVGAPSPHWIVTLFLSGASARAAVQCKCPSVRHRLWSGSFTGLVTSSTRHARCNKPRGLSFRSLLRFRAGADCVARRRSGRAAPPARATGGRGGGILGPGPAGRRPGRDAARVHAGDWGVLRARGVLAPRGPRTALRASRRPLPRHLARSAAARVPPGARGPRLCTTHGASAIHLPARRSRALSTLAVRQQQ